jgi:hypothetical protein
MTSVRRALRASRLATAMTCQDAPDLQITEVFTAKAAELMAKYGIDRALLAAAEPDTDHPADRKLDICAMRAAVPGGRL